MSKRTKMSLSHYHLTSFDMGELVPVGCYEALPGDTIQQVTGSLVRLSPMLAPVMHGVVARVHHFFVPLRLIWDDFEKFITGGPDGLDATVHPYLTVSNPGKGTLLNYLGLPNSGTSRQVSALPLRAYQLIYNEFYRDPDLKTPVTISTGNGSDTTTGTGLQKICWEKDYFTTARPWAQKGAAVTIPVGVGSVTVGGVALETGTVLTVADQTRGIRRVDNADIGAEQPLQTQSPAIDVNSLRLSLALQRYQEARAQYGSRYTEYLAYLGVNAQDSRLSRPEYLGGGKQVVQMSEVLQTGVTTSGNAAGVGNLLGHGIGAMRSRRWRKYIPEHGLILSLMSLRPKSMYLQAEHKMWNRTSNEDYFQRELQNLGQQIVKNREVFVGAASTDGVFGYQDRYDEYRRIESRVSADMSDTTLNFWHMARDFSSEPTLNNTFVECNPTKRIHAVQTNDVVWAMVNHSIQARRMMMPRANARTF